jgi:hypothetical protein
MTLRDDIDKALTELGVQIAGRYDYPNVWTAGDLATDLAAKLEQMGWPSRVTWMTGDRRADSGGECLV